MAEMTRRQQRAEVENFKALVFERLEGRDIQEAVNELIEKAEEVCMDEVGMPLGWETDNEDHQMMFYDIIAEQLIAAYFTPKDEKAPRIEDI
ncbi:hypothetical protein PBI_TRISCUIT_3 [Microbacterium phage Triscuit]|nr:hypothetical protein PBI_TRISCUIT_108 [Microbacterium phage Triscuit]AVR56980.1 hypothetical protein PBI_TRISCUIT_3 [Microbacterium phage Triscuit]